MKRRGFLDVSRLGADPAIGPAQVVPPYRAEHQPRSLCFSEPLLDRPVAAHLSRGEIAQADASALRAVARHRAAQADLEVVGMGAEDQEIDRHYLLKPNASSAASASPR